MEVRPEQEFSRVVLAAITKSSGAVDAQTLFLGAMEITDGKNQDTLSDAEVRNPLSYLLLNQAVRPLVEQAIPEEDASALSSGLNAVLKNTVRREDQSSEVQALRDQVTELQRAVAELRTRLPHD